MSKFLGFESYLVPLGASIDQAKDTLKVALTSRGWRLVNESLQIQASLGNWGIVANAFDGDSTSWCQSTAALPLWVGAQSPTPFTPTKFTIWGSSGLNESPSAFTLDYSDNGTVWTTLQAWAGETGWIQYERRSYIVTGATPHAYWRLTVTAGGGAANKAISNFILEDAAYRQLSNVYSFDIIPPVTEAIGGNGAFEFLRFRITANAISLYPLKRWTNPFPQQVYISQLTAGAVNASCTLNGSVVSFAGQAGNTALDNLMGLYGAIRDSNNADFLAWDWECNYPAPQNGDDAYVYIYGINRTAEPNKTFTVQNVSGGIHASYIQAGFQTDETLSPSPMGLTIDLTNGFIYFLQISARGLALATKATGGCYGPAHACWSQNAAAIAYLPDDNKFLTPIELIVGWDDPATDMDSWGRAATTWCLSKTSSANAEYRAGNWFAPPSRGVRRYRFTEIISSTANMDSYSTHGYASIQLFGSGMFYNNQEVGNDFQIHRVKTISHTIAFSTMPGGNSNVGNMTAMLPGFEIDDWFKFRGTAVNESLILIADTIGITPLAVNYNIGDNTLMLTDASGFQSSGFVIIGTEAFQYTGKNGNQLTGVTGAKYATLPARHFAGDSVGQGLWLVIINGGALFAGYNKPV